MQWSKSEKQSFASKAKIKKFDAKLRFALWSFQVHNLFINISDNQLIKMKKKDKKKDCFDINNIRNHVQACII